MKYLKHAPSFLNYFHIGLETLLSQSCKTYLIKLQKTKTSIQLTRILLSSTQTFHQNLLLGLHPLKLGKTQHNRKNINNLADDN